MPELWRGAGPDREKDRVREASDIVRVVGEHVALRAKGREFVGLCPFHDDHSPSMNVVPSKQIFHCFVCGSGGDVFTFVQKFHRMDFREAIEYLAQRSGIELSPRRGAGPEAGAADGVSRASLYGAGAFAQEFFRSILRHAEHGRAGRELVARRGIAPEMVERFQIGCAPDRWDGLLLTLRAKGQDERAFVEAGLVKRRETGDGFYDGLRNRLIFPIHDGTGRVVAFGGRRINDEDEPKYLNSPESRIFNKSATLYGLHLAARAIQSEGFALVTEGYTDAIACHQAGFTNAVATLGTALTREHARVLRRMCDTVVLLFDGDEAGQRAADRAMEVLFAEPIDVRIATLDRHTDAKDPDELLKRSGGGEVFRRVLDGASELLELRFTRLKESVRGAGLSALSRVIDEQVARMVELGLRDLPPVRQRLIVKRLAQVAGVDEATIARSVPAGRGRRVAGADAAGPGPGDGEQEPGRLLSSGALKASEHLLGCILCDGSLWAALGERRDFVAAGEYRSPVVARIAHVVEQIAGGGESPDLAGVLRACDEAPVQSAAVALASRIDRETDRSPERLHDHWRACLARAELDRAGREASGDLGAAIELKRRAHAFGGDRRVLPRPGD